MVALSTPPLPNTAARPGDPTLLIEGAEADEPQFIYAASPVANAPPHIINFKGVEVSGGVWRFSGDVVSALPGGFTVRFGGEPITLQGKSAATDANGHFDKVILMRMDGSDNGLASAQTTDANGLSSNVALYIVSPG